MAKTMLGFEITDFLEEFSKVGEPEEKFNSFVHKYARFRKKEIRKENAKPFEQYRIQMVESIASLCMVIGWLSVVVCLFYFCILPIIRDRFAGINGIVRHMNASHASIFVAIAIGLICFSFYFKNVAFRYLANVLSVLLGGFTIFARISVMGPYMDINSPAWIVFGNLLVAYVLINILASMMGGWLNRKLLMPNDAIRDMKHVFSPFEVVFLVIMILISGVPLFFFVNLDRFYAMLAKYQAAHIVTLAVPVVIFLLYGVWHANRMSSDSVDAWFCTSLEIYSTTLILQIFAVRSILKGIILWLVLAAVCVIVIIYLGSIIGNTVSYLTIFMIALNFIVSASINYYSEEAGIHVIGAATHWWMVAPAFLSVGLAIFVTIREMVQEKL